MLYQFQCQKEGTLFYYQHGNSPLPSHLITHCPICGSKRVELTGREYQELDETLDPDWLRLYAQRNILLKKLFDVFKTEHSIKRRHPSFRAWLRRLAKAHGPMQTQEDAREVLRLEEEMGAEYIITTVK